MNDHKVLKYCCDALRSGMIFAIDEKIAHCTTERLFHIPPA